MSNEITNERGADGKAYPVYPCDVEIREQLMEMRKLVAVDDQPIWSNQKLAQKIGCSTSVISQWLSPEGNYYSGNIKKWEKSALDFIRNEARRTSSGVTTQDCDVADQIRSAFEAIRKTNDVGMLLAEAGYGKTRGIELYQKDNPTSVLFAVKSWACDKASMESELFHAVGTSGYNKQTRRSAFLAKRLRGSDRLLIVDDAHKLTRPALQWLFDFHDETSVPLGLVGTFELEDKIADDAQRFSRVGLRFEIVPAQPRGLIEHIVRSHAPESSGAFVTLCELCEQVVAEHGHFRSANKQMKLAAELKSGSRKDITWPEAFKRAHTMLIRKYALV
jgi:DNA transposition AAA+ family ATPase